MSWRRGLVGCCLLTAGFAACGPRLPSDVPLGGSEEPLTPSRREAARSGPSTPSPGPDSADSELEGDEVEGDGETMEVVAEAEARAEGDCPPPAVEDPPSCESLADGACGSAFGSACERLAARLEPPVARALIGCLAAKARESECSALRECLGSAADKACISAADREWCAGYRKRCDQPPKGDSLLAFHEESTCGKLRGALLDDTKRELDECLKDECDPAPCLAKLSENE